MATEESSGIGLFFEDVGKAISTNWSKPTDNSQNSLMNRLNIKPESISAPRSSNDSSNQALSQHASPSSYGYPNQSATVETFYAQWLSRMRMFAHMKAATAGKTTTAEG